MDKQVPKRIFCNRCCTETHPHSQTAVLCSRQLYMPGEPDYEGETFEDLAEEVRYFFWVCRGCETAKMETVKFYDLHEGGISTYSPLGSRHT